jgi:hypothetical protein
MAHYPESFSHAEFKTASQVIRKYPFKPLQVADFSRNPESAETVNGNVLKMSDPLPHKSADKPEES